MNYLIIQILLKSRYLKSSRVQWCQKRTLLAAEIYYILVITSWTIFENDLRKMHSNEEWLTSCPWPAFLDSGFQILSAPIVAHMGYHHNFLAQSIGTSLWVHTCDLVPPIQHDNARYRTLKLYRLTNRACLGPAAERAWRWTTLSLRRRC